MPFQAKNQGDLASKTAFSRARGQEETTCLSNFFSRCGKKFLLPGQKVFPSPRKSSSSLRDFSFQGLEYMFQALEHMFQDLEHKFQGLEHKIVPQGKTFSARGKKISSVEQTKILVGPGLRAAETAFCVPLKNNLLSPFKNKSCVFRENSL